MTDFVIARRNMIESQLRPSRVRDERLLAAMAEIPRERFVPRELRGIAYRDEDLGLGGGRWLVAPMVFARLIEAADLRPNDRALVVGDPTGYGAAVLGRLCASVVMLECDGPMAREARRALAEQKATNVKIVEGDLAAGHGADAPYDVIVLAGAVVEVPRRLHEQLAEGGRLVAVIQAPGDSAKASCITRVASAFDCRAVFDAVARSIPGFAFAPKFMF